MPSSAVGLPARLRAAATRNPASAAALAYATISVIGALLLQTAWASDAARGKPVGFIDAMFLATSAISTTGLVTLDPGTTFSFWGELILLLLIQIGGVGYMTFMSFAYLIMQDRLSPLQTELTRASFGITREYYVPRFVRSVVVATIMIEAVGAFLLSLLFARAGVENPVWNGIFHAVSAFCTAGFSLFETSLEAFKGDPPVLYTISILSYLGAIGFIVLTDVTEQLWVPMKRVGPTSKLIIFVSVGLALFATVFLLIFEPSIAALPVDQRVDNAFFQAMTASTTVGFNTVPIGALAPASIMVLYLLMFVGASPSGTGGGIKSTTAALLVAGAVSTITGRTTITSGGVTVPMNRVVQAMSTLVAALAVVFIAVTLMDLTGRYPFDRQLFEVISALGTVGLSMGLTAELNDAGKLIIIAAMYVGRVGILAFFVALAANGAREGKRRVSQGDVII